MAAKRDFIVGLFVIAAIIVLAGATMVLRHWDIFNRRIRYYVRFDHVRQLDVGSPVLAYGIVVGSVSDLEYIGMPHPIRVTMLVDKKVALYSNAKMRVVPAQVIGNTTLNIDDTGHPGAGVHELKPGEEIIGTEPVYMESIMTETLQGLGKLLNDNQTQAAFKGTMLNLESVTKRMDETFKHINEQFMPLVSELKQSSANLNKLLVDARSSTTHVADTITSAGESFRGASADYARAARTLNQQIGETAEKIQKLIDQVQGIVKTNQAPINDTVGELRKTSRQLGELIDRVNQGEGTLGKLITDPRPFQQLQQLIDSLSQRLTGGGGAATFPNLESPQGDRSQFPQKGPAFPKVKTPK